MKKHGTLFSEAKLYSSIYDFPYLKWSEFCKGNLNACCKTEGLLNLNKISELKLKIRNEVIDKFEISIQFKNYINSQKELAIMKAEQALNPDPSKLIFMRILEIDIAEMEKPLKGSKSDSFEVLSSHLPYDLPEDVSIYKFMGKVNSLNRK